MGSDKSEGWDFLSLLHMMGQTSLPPSLTLGHCKAWLHKILLYVNLLYPTPISLCYLNKTRFINSNIFEITNKFITSNKTNF